MGYSSASGGRRDRLHQNGFGDDECGHVEHDPIVDGWRTLAGNPLLVIPIDEYRQSLEPAVAGSLADCAMPEGLGRWSAWQASAP
jgi:hypothetical protein